MFIVFGAVFLLFIIVYFSVSAAVVYHLYHYTLPGWSAARVVLPSFFIISALLFGLAAYFFLTIPLGLFG